MCLNYNKMERSIDIIIETLYIFTLPGCIDAMKTKGDVCFVYIVYYLHCIWLPLAWSPELDECASSFYLWLLLYLNNKHVLSSSLKVHPPLPLVDTQRLLLGAHRIPPIQDDEHICVCASSKHITCKDFNLIRNNYKMIKKKYMYKHLSTSNDKHSEYLQMWCKTTATQ